MADVEWQPLPALWPEPAVWTDVGELMLLVFTQDGVPTCEVSRRAKAGSSRDDPIANGTADTFEAANAAARFEVKARSSESGILTHNVFWKITARRVAVDRSLSRFDQRRNRGSRPRCCSRSITAGSAQWPSRAAVDAQRQAEAMALKLGSG